MAEVAQAFVPGHVTGFFRPQPDDDPTAAGSQGAGVVLSEGVSVTVHPTDTPEVTLNGEAVRIEAVARVLEALGAEASVRGVSDLPLGAGFGVSGAMALGAALACNVAFDRQLSTNELVTVAHGAEVQAGTGLGDVVAQARGGLTIRLEPGGPHSNVLDGVPARERIEYLTLGERPTDDTLEGADDELDEAGRQALSRLVSEPTVESFMRSSRRFSREADLLSEQVQSVIRDVADADGRAAMAMLGETVFALDSGLSDAGYEPEVTSIDHAGATLESPQPL
jgi:pantoate kinase